MAQFDLHHLPSPKAPGRLLLDIQSNHLSLLASRLVIPLIPVSILRQPMRRLNPVFNILGEDFALATQETTSIPRNMLGPVIGSLKAERDSVLAALDFLVIGY